MDLLQQCAQWFENGEHQKIVDAIEALPEEERTPELDSELARAYNNVAEATDRKLFRKAVSLLKRHEAYLEFPPGLRLLLSGSGGKGLTPLP